MAEGTAFSVDEITPEQFAQMVAAASDEQILTGFFETTTGLYRELNRLPAGAIRQAARLKSQWKKLLSSPASKERA